MSTDLKKLSLQIDADAFLPATKEERAELVKIRESTTYWQDAWRRLKKNKVAMVSLFVIVILGLIAIFGPMLSPYTYSDMNVHQVRQHPAITNLFSNIFHGRLGDAFDMLKHARTQHWFGTDSKGRDIFIRVLFGTRISLSVGLLASFMILIIGAIYGAISGLLGGRIDNLMMRIVDILYSVPDILIVILLSVVLKEPLNKAFSGNDFLKGMSMIGPGLISIFITLSTLYWVGMARIVRGQVLSLKEQEYVTAARALGAGKARIIFRHLIPNCLGPIIVTTTFQIPSAIFTESFLSFIGLGVDAPMASLGSLTSDAMNGFTSYPYRLFFPAFFISVIILAFNLLGDGLRDALDPRMKK